MPPLTRATIVASTVRVLREGAGSRPDVRLVRQDDCLLVLKDFAQGNLTMRLLGLFLISREREAYRRLVGLEGIPCWAGQLDAYTMATEYIPGWRASEAPVEMLTPAFFDRLLKLINQVHARGVVHGDLKRLDNILVGEDGNPYLIDFSAAFWNGSNPASAFVMPHLIDDDHRAVYKLKFRRVPELLTLEEEAFLNDRSGIEHFFRVAREYFRKPVQHLAGSEPGA